MGEVMEAISIQYTGFREGPSVQILDLIIPKIATGVGGSEAHRSFPW